MKIGLKHRRLRCERVGNHTYLADDYDIVSLFDATVLGKCELRNAAIDLLPYSGNVSYTIFNQYRGRGFAKAALKELCVIATECGMTELWVTCDSQNKSSVGVCKSVGAVFVDELSVLHLEEFQNRGIAKISRFKIYL